MQTAKKCFRLVFLATCVSVLALACYVAPAEDMAPLDAPIVNLGAFSHSVADSAAAEGLTPVVASAVRTAHATLHPMNQSGVLAMIDFVDDGSTLFINGTATGLDPEATYLTLIYDNGARPGGSNACQPTIFDPQDPRFLLDRMVVGSWVVDANGNGMLSAINTNVGADYVPIGLFRATSVRRVLGPPPAPGAPPPTKLEACGRVAIQGKDN